MKKGSASTSDSKTQNPFAQSLEKRAPNPFAQAFQAIVKKTSPTSSQIGSTLVQAKTDPEKELIPASTGPEIIQEGAIEIPAPKESTQEELLVQKDPDPQDGAKETEPKRHDYVFMMGSKGGFFVAARKFFKQEHPQAKIITLSTLAGIFAKLRELVSDDKPLGNLYIVSHANQDGTLSFGFDKKDKDKKVAYGELKQALEDQKDVFALNGGIDDKSKIHIKGCNIGRNSEMLEALDEAFGEESTVDAPTHKQGYQYDSAGVASQFFNTFVLEYPGNIQKSEEQLALAFASKYQDLHYSANDWRMAVWGRKKHQSEVKLRASSDSKEVDKHLKEALAELDPEASDYADQVAELQEKAKQDKQAIQDQASKDKSSKATGKSPGVKRKVFKKYKATLFKGTRPPLLRQKSLRKPSPGMPKLRIVAKLGSLPVRA